MKRNKYLLYSAAALLLAGPAWAADDDNTAGATSTTPGTIATPADTSTDAKHSTQFFSSKSIVGATVKDNAGVKIGEVEEIYLDPQRNAVFAVLDLKGSQNALVPLQALQMVSTKGLLKTSVEVTVNKTKAEVQAGPLIGRNEWHRLDDTGFTQSIYSHYQVEAPAIGGSSSPSGTSSGATSTYHRNSKAPESRSHPVTPDNP